MPRRGQRSVDITHPLLTLLRGKFDNQIEMWLSPRFGGMPVRIKITQSNGDFVDQQLSGSSAP